MTSQLDRKIPPILWNEMKKAIWYCERVGLNSDQMFELLSIYRSNYVKHIAARGITNFGIIDPSLTVQELAPIKPEFSSAIEKLDEAFQELHKYLGDGDKDEFIAQAVAEKIISLNNSVNATRPRTHKWTIDDLDEVVDFFKRKNLKDSDNKKAIYSDAKERFSQGSDEGSEKQLTDYQLNKAIKTYKSKC